MWASAPEFLHRAAERFRPCRGRCRCRRRRWQSPPRLRRAAARSGRSRWRCGHAADRRRKTAAASGRAPDCSADRWRRHPVSMKSAGSSRSAGLSGTPSIRKRLMGGDGRAAIGRLADPVEDAPQQARPDREMQRLAQEAHAHIGQPQPDRRLQHLDDHACRRPVPPRGRAGRGRHAAAPARPRSARPRHCGGGTAAGPRWRVAVPCAKSSGRMGRPPSSPAIAASISRPSSANPSSLSSPISSPMRRNRRSTASSPMAWGATPRATAASASSIKRMISSASPSGVRASSTGPPPRTPTGAGRRH